jgi:hypothetical protein
MDFRSIAFYLSRKFPSVRTIHGDIVAMLEFDAVSDATMTHWLREIAIVFAIEEPSKSLPTMNHDKIDDVILLALAELSFASVRNLS